MVFQPNMEDQTTEEPDITEVNVLSSVHVASSTKDSVHVKWAIGEHYAAFVQGYKVRYQATGSHVIQYSQRLPGYQNDYDIKQLHEDTSYEVCIEVYANITATDNEPCIQATTKTDSLHVALASAFGAFLALGIIVAFVFLAKWQHTRRRRRKHLQAVGPNGDIYHSRELRDVDYEMSELSMQVNESQMKMSELDSQLDLDCANDNLVAVAGDLSDCSEEPRSYHSSNYLAGSYHSSNYLTGSRERCCHCDVDLSDSHSARSARSKYSREKSIESSRSLLSRQYSVDSYGSKRASLRKQRSQDSSRRELVSQKSHDSGLYPFPRQKSQESDYSDYSPSSSVQNHKRKRGRPHDTKFNTQSNHSNSPGEGHRSSRSREPSPNVQLFTISSSEQERSTETLPITSQPNCASQNSLVSNQAGKPPDVRPKDTQSRNHFHYPLAKQTTIQCTDAEESGACTPVNEGGHVNGLRQNSSCPNW